MNTKDTQLLQKYGTLLISDYANQCAMEDFILGKLKPNDEVPVSRYFSESGVKSVYEYMPADFSNGSAIENRRLKNLDYDETCYKVFCKKIDFMFENLPVNYKKTADNDIRYYKHGVYAYLKSLYPLFREVVATEITDDFVLTAPDILDNLEQKIYYYRIKKFIQAILLKKIKHGARIDKYIKDLPFISPVLMRLITKQKGRYFLQNNDVESIEFKLALLSCFIFYYVETSRLFEHKLAQR